jgi:hypothetical protein
MEDTSTARHWPGEHALLATDMYTVIEELLEAMFFVRSGPAAVRVQLHDSQNCETVNYGQESLEPKMTCVDEGQQQFN